MPRKTYYKKTVRVTFELPSDVEAEQVHLVGEFNDWNAGETRLQERSDGRFSTTVSLEPESEYRYRFLIDGERWENDWDADDYVSNEFGTEDSIVRL